MNAIRQINLKIYLERIYFVIITRCWKNSSRYLNRSRNVSSRKINNFFHGQQKETKRFPGIELNFDFLIP